METIDCTKVAVTGKFSKGFCICGQELTREQIMRGTKYHSNSCYHEHGKKYSVNKDFFKTWSEPMAYILGFIAADGNISISKNDSVLGFGLQERDRRLLEDIRKALGSDHPIKDYKKAVWYSISSKSLCQDLIGVGITPRKTFTLQFPEVPVQYLNHFVRGYFDGDGTVNRTSWLLIGFCGNKGFMSSLNDTVSKELGTSKKTVKVVHKSDNGEICEIVFYTRDARKIRDWMYKDATIYLRRKYDRCFSLNREVYKGGFLRVADVLEQIGLSRWELVTRLDKYNLPHFRGRGGDRRFTVEQVEYLKRWFAEEWPEVQKQEKQAAKDKVSGERHWKFRGTGVEICKYCGKKEEKPLWLIRKFCCVDHYRKWKKENGIFNPGLLNPSVLRSSRNRKDTLEVASEGTQVEEFIS